MQQDIILFSFFDHICKLGMISLGCMCDLCPIKRKGNVNMYSIWNKFNDKYIPLVAIENVSRYRATFNILKQYIRLQYGRYCMNIYMYSHLFVRLGISNSKTKTPFMVGFAIAQHHVCILIQYLS